MVAIQGGRDLNNTSKCSLTLLLLCVSLGVNFYNSSIPKYVVETMPITTATMSDVMTATANGLVASATGEAKAVSPPSSSQTLWSEDQIVEWMTTHPNRAYFTNLFYQKEAGFRTGIEVGTAAGRFSEHFLTSFHNNASTSSNNIEWTIVEPFPNKDFEKRYHPKTGEGSWKSRGLLGGLQKMSFYQLLSLDKKLLQELPNDYYDFIYLDGDHSYKGVKQEMFDFWPKVKAGGVLAGHDYCDYGEASLPCKGCENIPKCGPYTEYGMKHGKKKKMKRKKKRDGGGGVSVNQHDVVKAVQEWMVETNHPKLTLRFTKEDFTRESLAKDGMDYDLVITNTRTPSWYIIKPP